MGELLQRIMLVGLGGFVGSVFRYLASGYVQDVSGSIGFPFGTIAVNLTGCFLIGFLSYLADARGVFSAETRVVIFIGILGGFTTFSTFGNETMNLLRDRQMAYALANIGVQVVAGLFLVWAGRSLAFLIWR